MAAMAVLSIRSGQMARSVRFGLRMADFILPRIRCLSAAKPSHFYQVWQSDWPFYEGRPAAVAVLSKPIAVLSRPASLSKSSLERAGKASKQLLKLFTKLLMLRNLESFLESFFSSFLQRFF